LHCVIYEIKSYIAISVYGPIPILTADRMWTVPRTQDTFTAIIFAATSIYTLVQLYEYTISVPVSSNACLKRIYLAGLQRMLLLSCFLEMV